MDRIAAAILLVRAAPRGTEVLLVERAPELRFFGGYLALPGGVRDEADLRDSGDAADALRACAARELFEETGVLAAGGELAAAERRSVREALLREELGPWRTLGRGTEDRDALREVCRIRTPPFAPVRYDTVFYLAALADGEEPDVWPGELVGSRFWRPADALAAWRRGEVLIVPPVLILLELLQDRDPDAFVAAARETAGGYERGVLHRVRFSPGVILAALRTPTLPPATTTNTLIVGEERLWVVDPATPEASEQERLFALLDALAGEGRRIEGVLLTHEHPDHVGAVQATARRYGVPIRGHPDTLARLAGPVEPGARIDDGERIDLGRAPDGGGGWQLEAVHTPGHARGHLCFRETRYDAVAVGDMLSTVSTIVIDPPEGHMRTYLDSLRRLLRLPMTTLYPAHGPAVRDGHRLVRHYLRHREQRQHKIEDALARGPSSAEALLGVVYDDVDPRMHSVAARSLLAGLEMLAEDGRARERDGVWELVAR